MRVGGCQDATISYILTGPELILQARAFDELAFFIKFYTLSYMLCRLALQRLCMYAGMPEGSCDLCMFPVQNVRLLHRRYCRHLAIVSSA
jgi:hypothetical protein